MSGNHYQTLGVHPTATPEQIKSAYRRLVLQHHPDRSRAKDAMNRFLVIQEAYETLNDPARRKSYDELLARQKEAARPKPPAAGTANSTTSGSSQAKRTDRPTDPTIGAARVTVAQEVRQVQDLFRRGRITEAERAANALLIRDVRSPILYAVVSEIHRSRGDFKVAAKFMAYAAQLDPANNVYMRRYEELLNSSARAPGVVGGNPGTSLFAPVVGFMVALVGACYVALSVEPAMRLGIDLISTWTAGLTVMLFIGGISIGAGLSSGGHLDRFDLGFGSGLGGLGPATALAPIAMVNFWLAVGVYAILGLVQGRWSFTASRLLAATLAVLFILMTGASMQGKIDVSQVLLWGGNLVYLGALSGWLVADSLKG